MANSLLSGADVRPPYDAILGLGSNVGDKIANIDEALQLLTKSGDVRIQKRSRNYRTAPWGVVEQDWFVNACVAVETELSARALLVLCQAIERNMGRVRQQRWGPRLIDVDILIYRGLVISEPDLTVPHPLMAQRGFVLVPLRDVAPQIIIGGKTLPALIAAIDVTDVIEM